LSKFEPILGDFSAKISAFLRFRKEKKRSNFQKRNDEEQQQQTVNNNSNSNNTRWRSSKEEELDEAEEGGIEDTIDGSFRLFGDDSKGGFVGFGSSLDLSSGLHDRTEDLRGSHSGGLQRHRVLLVFHHHSERRRVSLVHSLRKGALVILHFLICFCHLDDPHRYTDDTSSHLIDLSKGIHDLGAGSLKEFKTYLFAFF